MSLQAATNDGVTIAYAVEGPEDAPVVVLVHGLGYAGASGGWGRLPSLLAERFRVVTIDNRGIGASDSPPGPYTAAVMAGDVVAVLDDLDVDRAHVVGSSLGGMIAQELAISHPQRVERLVLLSTTPGGAGAVPMPQVTVDLLMAMPTMEPAAAQEAAVRNALAPGFVERRPTLVEEILAQRATVAQAPEAWMAQAHAGTTYDGGGRLEAVTAPTLVLHGDEDVVVAPGNGERLVELLADARLLVLAGHGHLPFWEDAAAVAAPIVEFLGG